MSRPSRFLLIIKAIFHQVFSSDFWRHYVTFIFDIFYKHIALACLLAFILFYVGHGGIGSIFLLLLCILSLIRCAEHRLVFHNDEPPQSRFFVELPSTHGLPYESVTIPCGRVNLHAFLIYQATPLRRQVPTVLQLHGNAGNIGHRLVSCHQLFHNCQINILALDYRGFGKSTGTPCEEGLYCDAQAALDYLHTRKDIDTSKIVIMSQSLGGAVAIELASRPTNANKIYGLVIENSFTSLPALGRIILNLPVVRSIPDFLVHNQFQSIRKISRINLPTLFISGLKDTLIPPRMMVQLHDACSSSHKKIVYFEHGGHNDTWAIPGYNEYMNTFFIYLSTLKPLNHGDVVLSV